jgi:hypothetical protein
MAGRTHLSPTILPTSQMSARTRPGRTHTCAAPTGRSHAETATSPGPRSPRCAAVHRGSARTRATPEMPPEPAPPPVWTPRGLRLRLELRGCINRLARRPAATGRIPRQPHALRAGGRERAAMRGERKELRSEPKWHVKLEDWHENTGSFAYFILFPLPDGG